MSTTPHPVLGLDVLGATSKIPVGVLGATGTVGQRFVLLLSQHPWFEPVAVAASERSTGQTYAEATRWVQAAPIPGAVATQIIQPCRPELRPTPGQDSPRLVFSALDAAVAGEIESEFARQGHLVVSNARSHRMAPDVPLLVPEVNPDHLELAQRQSTSPGLILTNPNCSTIGLVLALKPLVDAFGVEKLQVVTLQAISGAGIPGVSSYEITDNVIPFIGGEEEKMEMESRKILGRIADGRIADADLVVSAQCNRVPVVDGHLLCISVALRSSAEEEELIDAWRSFRSVPQELALPTAPRTPIHYLTEPDAPQPRLHRELEQGMATSIGRLRPCPLLDYRFVALSHNTLRGAAGGALLVAELGVARGLHPTIRGVEEKTR